MVSLDCAGRVRYSDGTLNTIFGADLTRLQELLTAIFWQLAIPGSKVVLSLVFVLVQNASIGTLTLCIFPFIFTSGPSELSSKAAIASSQATKESISKYANGVACQKIIWLADAQSSWLAWMGDQIAHQQTKHAPMRWYSGAAARARTGTLLKQADA